MNAAAPCALSDGDDIVARRSSDRALVPAPSGLARGDRGPSPGRRSPRTLGAPRGLPCETLARRAMSRTAGPGPARAVVRRRGPSRGAPFRDADTTRRRPFAQARNTWGARTHGRASDHQQHGLAARGTEVIDRDGRGRHQESPSERRQDRRQRVNTLGVTRLCGHHELRI
jgi:hypothetical protein